MKDNQEIEACISYCKGKLNNGILARSEIEDSTYYPVIEFYMKAMMLFENTNIVSVDSNSIESYINCISELLCQEFKVAISKCRVNYNCVNHSVLIVDRSTKLLNSSRLELTIIIMGEGKESNGSSFIRNFRDELDYSIIPIQVEITKFIVNFIDKLTEFVFEYSKGYLDSEIVSFIIKLS